MMDNDTVKIPAAWLIERSGFGRGHADGAVGLSTKHPLAVINRGGATARDVVRFARRIKGAVVDRFGIELRPEPIFVGFNDDADVEYLRG
jgi:UDP-N-acetylmuramate dehydrogenase